MNAFDTDDGKLILDVMKYEAPPGFPNPDGSPTRPVQPGARLVRWTFDLRSENDRYSERVVSDLVGELCRGDRAAGKHVRGGGRRAGSLVRVQVQWAFQPDRSDVADAVACTGWNDDPDPTREQAAPPCGPGALH